MEPISIPLAGSGAYIGVSDRTVRRAIEAGDITVRYAGRKPLVLLSELRAWVESLPTERASA